MRIGFAGLGRMGAPMARNLIAAGHEVSVWNRSPERAEAFALETGAGVAATPRVLAEGAEVVVTMLADDAASSAVHLGEDGLFAASGPLTLLEMGTMSPDHIADLAGKAPAGWQVIDAPVSGSTAAAEGASLMIMAGCTEDQAAPLRPALDAMGKTVICLGNVGDGAVMKLAVNMLIHSLNQTLAEALSLTDAAGIDTGTAFAAIEASAAAAPMLSYRKPLYLDEAAHPVSFTVALARKDMEVTQALAAQLGVALPQGAVVLERLRAAETAGRGARDMASMVDFTRKDKS
ncbi:NAD(P)-dependent oxidoreductase [Thioclava electrotropha]|uniref:NAD(P)-dependent oxidoreductase n=2 Tax=Thioclava electrotropha TaxID=1549850 RepID=A0ABX6YT87_9RHOB|nr:NAD(P)-dependent oxidoreductase [Thioclava electrotropha]